MPGKGPLQPGAIIQTGDGRACPLIPLHPCFEQSLQFVRIIPSRYACSLSLTSTASGHYGPFFRLRVPSPQAQFKPRIDPSFPQVFPENPVIGDTVYVECFAYSK